MGHPDGAGEHHARETHQQSGRSGRGFRPLECLRQDATGRARRERGRRILEHTLEPGEVEDRDEALPCFGSFFRGTDDLDDFVDIDDCDEKTLNQMGPWAYPVQTELENLDKLMTDILPEPDGLAAEDPTFRATVKPMLTRSSFPCMRVRSSRLMCTGMKRYTLSLRGWKWRASVAATTS